MFRQNVGKLFTTGTTIFLGFLVIISCVDPASETIQGCSTTMSASPTGIHGRPVFHFNKGLRVGLKESSGSSNSFSGSGPDSTRLPTDSAESSEDQEHRSTEVRICKSLSTGSLGELAARATQCVASCPLVVVKWDRFDFFKAMSDKLRQNVIDKSRPRTFMKGQKLVAVGTFP